MEAYLPWPGSSHASTWTLTCLHMGAHMPPHGSSHTSNWKPICLHSVAQTGTVMSSTLLAIAALSTLTSYCTPTRLPNVCKSVAVCCPVPVYLLLICCKAQCRSASLQVALLPWRTARLPSPTWASHWHKRRPSSWRPPMSWCQQSSCAALCRTLSSTKSPSWHLQTRSSTIACCSVDCPVLPHAALPCLAPCCLVLSCFVLTCLVLSRLVLSCLVLSCIEFHHVLSEWPLPCSCAFFWLWLCVQRALQLNTSLDRVMLI